MCHMFKNIFFTLHIPCFITLEIFANTLTRVEIVAVSSIAEFIIKFSQDLQTYRFDQFHKAIQSNLYKLKVFKISCQNSNSRFNNFFN